MHSTITSEENATCIVGMACRLPGGISSPSGMWDLLSEKRSGQSSVPKTRFNIDGFYHPEGTRGGHMNVKGGYFLDEDVNDFDNYFFGINSLEASYMDPQQRKLLEVVYECLESAGVSMEDISGTNTAVYVANFTMDFHSMIANDPDYLHRYAATGRGVSILSNRISHVFNLKGPSLTLDTACSSSVYALHQAVAAIKNGDCDGAIVASANLILSHESHMVAAKGGFLSKTSTCHTFDTSADGYARAEAVNAIYLKPISSAKRDADNIRAVIRGTAINSNGKTTGITLPSPALQEAVIRKAYQNAGLDLSETDYVECHGTGTAVGDPIEIDGLARCFNVRNGPQLLIGSVKTSLGHGEGASGLTSIIKVALAFERGMIPPTVGVENLNPALNLEMRNMKVVQSSEPWPREIRRASVNSFGYGGSNGHVILESVESYFGNSPLTNGVLLGDNDMSVDETFVLPFSAKSTASLEMRRQTIVDLISAQKPGTEQLKSLADALMKRQSSLPLRDFVTVTTSPEPITSKSVSIAEKIALHTQPLPFAFIFTGQGSQYAGMAKELLKHSTCFLACIREMDSILQSLPSEHAPAWSMEQSILDSPDTSQVNDVARTQPLCTAIQIALVNVLHSWGVTPSAVIGHSSGEIAAAYSAGLLTSKQAILAAYFRGMAVGRMQQRGSMLAAGVGAELANSMIKDLSLDAVRVACVNSPEGVTFSGSTQAIEALETHLQTKKKFARKLQTGGRAYHSHMVSEIGDLYEELVAPYLAEVTGACKAFTKMYSTVALNSNQVESIDSTTNMSAYLRRNLEQPVQFNSSLASLIADKSVHLIEIGPHSALKGPVKQICGTQTPNNTSPYSPTLIRGENANLCMMKLAGVLFTQGHALDWRAINNLELSGPRSAFKDLPSYPWDYSKKLPWHEPRCSVEMRNRKYIRHELLGTQTVAGNGIDWSWRNILKLSEMPWLRDHKLESQVVLPGAAYIALAIEALSQVLGLKNALDARENVSFEATNVNISTAFVVPDDREGQAADTELHTTMCLRKISVATLSADWYDFSVSSWASEQATLHCAGSIRVAGRDNETTSNAGLIVSDRGYETWSMPRWYDKLREEGLNFGSHFQSLTALHTHSSRTCTDVIADIDTEPPSAKDAGIFYPIHPITLDACFQAASMGFTAGNVKDFRAFVPVFISECRINLSHNIGDSKAERSKIHAHTEKTGLSTHNVDCTLRRPCGEAMIDIKGIRMSLYAGKAPVGNTNQDVFQQRHPCLRVVWKPDILRVHRGGQEALAEYIIKFAADRCQDVAGDDSLITFEALLDLAGHKTPRMRVVEFGDGSQSKMARCLSVLGKDTGFPRYQSWNLGSFDQDGSVSLESTDCAQEPFDVALIPQNDVFDRTCTASPNNIANITSQLSQNAIVMTRASIGVRSALEASGFTVLDLPGKAMLAIRAYEPTTLKGTSVFIIKPNQSSVVVDTFAHALEQYLSESTRHDQLRTVSLCEINGIQLSTDDVCISLLELETEFFATMTKEDMDLLRNITDRVSTLVWLTGAGMMTTPNPDLAMSSGLSRALMLEHPSLNFTILDIGDASELLITCENVHRVLTPRCTTDDKEFTQLGNILYVSRFAPDLDLNLLFRQRLEEKETMQTATLAEISPAKLSIGQVGVTNTMHFQHLSEPFSETPAGFVDVNLKAVSLNAKDVYAINGRVETQNATLAVDSSGVVAAVGPDVTHVKPGDRVVCHAPNHFRTAERFPAAAVHKLLPTEDFGILPSLLTVNATALLALRDRARIRSGESVLIHAGAGAFGLAAIAMAQNLGAVVYTTVGSQAKREFLIKDMGVPAEHIFNSRDASFVDGVMAATGRGVDVIINSLVGDLLHASWGCIAPFGRFVEIGKRDIIDAGKLDMRMFLKNATFTAFDLSELYFSEDSYYREMWFQLTTEVLQMYRAGQIKPLPITTFDVADIAQAYRYFNHRDRIGKVVISMEDEQSRVLVAPSQYKTVFNPNKTYLLVGCLGGLGRSLSRWMLLRGARKFTFLGRSGCDKPAARQLVQHLEDAGASVTVVRGDVSNSTHIRQAISACLEQGPIGGVVQAAMGLREALFTQMTSDAWHTAIQPKWRGTWNLHQALEGHDEALDFFLMTSSVSGSWGTATESNYCAANCFLDAFAHWRRSQGKPAMSVGLGMISEVGYLHEHPDIQALLLRKGIHPLNEDELLQVLDFALASSEGIANGPHQAHILTGLESNNMRKLMEKGFEASNGLFGDARSSILAASFLAENDAMEAPGQGGLEFDQASMVSEWVKDVPASFRTIFSTEPSAHSISEALLQLLKKRFSSLILMPVDQVNESTPLASYGVDSMLAAEFRIWFWNTFKVDVPYLDLFSTRKGLSDLSQFVEGKLIANWAKL